LRRMHEVKSYLRSAMEYCHCLLNGDLSILLTMSDGKRRLTLKALSNLAKFLGLSQEFYQLVRQYGLRWSGKSKDIMFLERLLRAKNPSEIYEWARKVKEKVPRLSAFIDFLAVSGLRFIEAYESYHLIIRLYREGRLEQYYNKEKAMLEHWKFPTRFIRHTKKAFVSIVPEQYIMKIISSGELPSIPMIEKLVKEATGRQRFSDLREAHASILSKYLRQPEIDYLHGRIGGSTFMAHYYNPALIEDLKQRALKGIEEITTKLNPLSLSNRPTLS